MKSIRIAVYTAIALRFIRSMYRKLSRPLRLPLEPYYLYMPYNGKTKVPTPIALCADAYTADMLRTALLLLPGLALSTDIVGANVDNIPAKDKIALSHSRLLIYSSTINGIEHGQLDGYEPDPGFGQLVMLAVARAFPTRIAEKRGLI